MSTRIKKVLIKMAQQQLLLPFYHMVTDEVDTVAKYLYPPRKAAVFKKDLDTLLQVYKPITLYELLVHIKQGIPFGQPVFHLTFDDGLANFYEIVAPILESKGVPATFFVNTDFVDNRALFYRYKASLLLQEYQKSKVKYNPLFKAHLGKNVSARDYLLSIKYENRSELDEIGQKMSFSFQEYLGREKPYLSSQQITSLIDRGFTVGAHSKNHPVFKDISLAEQLSQTKESINWIQTRFDVPYRAFSFPFHDIGVQKSFFKEISSWVDISFGTSDQKQDELYNNFQRISFELADDNIADFINRSNAKFLVRRLLNRHKMPRD